MQIGPWDVCWEWPRTLWLTADHSQSPDCLREINVVPYRRWAILPLRITGAHYIDPWWLHSNFYEWWKGLQDVGHRGYLVCLFQYGGFSLWWITRPYCLYARIDAPPYFYEIRTLWLRWGFWKNVKDGDYVLVKR